MNQIQPINYNTQPGKIFTVSELVRRHLTDESHTTSDEELKNVKLKLYNVEEIPEESFFSE